MNWWTCWTNHKAQYKRIKRHRICKMQSNSTSASAVTQKQMHTQRQIADQTEANGKDLWTQEITFKQRRSKSWMVYGHMSQCIFAMLHCNIYISKWRMHAQSRAWHLKSHSGSPLWDEVFHACIKGSLRPPLYWTGRPSVYPTQERGKSKGEFKKKEKKRRVGGMVVVVVVGGERPVSAAFLPQPGHWAAGVGSTFRSGGDWAAAEDRDCQSLDLRW